MGKLTTLEKILLATTMNETDLSTNRRSLFVYGRKPGAFSLCRERTCTVFEFDEHGELVDLVVGSV